MYWYGEAGVIDLGKAEAWFRKAAAKGNKTAVAALDVMKQRELRRADIDYWISKYDGVDLRAGEFRCAAPRIPAISKTNEEITKVASSVEAWQTCYNGFVANMNNNSPLSKRIPADISVLLNQQELETAKAHLDEVHQRIAADASIGAKLLLADFAAWRSATEKWVSEHNALIKGQ
jgi:TPR repeat protein